MEGLILCKVCKGLCFEVKAAVFSKQTSFVQTLYFDSLFSLQAHLATMPVSAMMTNHQPISTTSLNGNTNIEDVEFMSTSSDSSSSGESG